MHIVLKTGEILAEPCDLLVVGIFHGAAHLQGVAGTVNKTIQGALAELIAQEGFEGKEGEWLLFHSFGRLQAKKIAVVGLGDRAVFGTDAIRKIGAVIVRNARGAKAKTVATSLYGSGIGGVSACDAAEALCEGMRLGAYRFHPYKGTATKEKHEVETVTIFESERARILPAERGCEDARVLAEATAFARDLVNTPSAEMTPKRMAEIAGEIAKASPRLSVEIFDAVRMEKMGMHAALSVGRGSIHQPFGAHLVYKPKRTAKASKAKKIAIVGKAVTFDSGGLNIKPSSGMATMKIDMAGAAAVLGLFKALPHLRPEAEVHGIFLAVENMPSGSAYRPGDVVRAMNGTTIEILNTDAEGRVTLADALSYAATLKPDAIVDLATLTGACVVALGEEIAGLMANDRKLANRLLAAARNAGEGLWELPLHEPYRDMVKSRIADIKNDAPRDASAITAGLFLSHFVKNIPWAHIDIAGPSYAEKETRPDMPFGGTGFGVRLLARYLAEA